jgi:hypothetical protein
MAHNIDVPLALSNLAARAQVSAAHMSTSPATWRLEGSRLTDLAASLAGMSKQAMGDLVDPMRSLGPGHAPPDPLDARARRIHFTATGLVWLQAFQGRRGAGRG